MTRIRLRGMTWNHPRGFAPLEACAAVWKARTDVEITWDRRSLQDFETFPVDQLAREYDLIVIDHPHIGQVARESCLLALDDERLAPIERGSVGASYASYRWCGRQWALPIDAAAQVQAWRPDRLSAPPADWNEVQALARGGRVALPLRSPHALMCLYTLVAQLGKPAAVDGPDLFDLDVASEAVGTLRRLVACIDPRCFEYDPIAVFEHMSKIDSDVDCVPLIYGYVSYACDDFRPARIAFADMPELDGRPSIGSALGGTGIAMSARSAHPSEALEFALWVAGAQAQVGSYAEAGGQPGHAAAWEDDRVNARAGNFYRATRATLEGAWVRPRHDGYMPFQDAASRRLLEGLRTDEPARALVTDINRMFRATLARIRPPELDAR